MNLKINRESYSNNETFLFHLYNDLGYTDLEMAYNYNDRDGNKRFSKWVRFDYIITIENDERVEGTIDTKKSFFNKITHRRILDIEVVLDIDETPAGSTNPDEIKIYSKNILKDLKAKGFGFEVYFSGSKSIHAHFIFPQLRLMRKYDRTRFKRDFISKFGADKMKSSDRTMIALEGAPHWKTGVKKEVFNIE